MILLAIDPGNIESAYCLMSSNDYKPIEFGKVKNYDLLDNIVKQGCYDYMAIEMIASMGMAVGATVFDTCVWIGRFIQASKSPYDYIYRKEEKIELCGSMKAKDANIRQALIDRFGEVGTKSNPGWFYKFHSDIWSAYAVGVVMLDKILRGD